MIMSGTSEHTTLPFPFRFLVHRRLLLPPSAQVTPPEGSHPDIYPPAPTTHQRCSQTPLEWPF